jgi:putative addiction module killer protein
VQFNGFDNMSSTEYNTTLFKIKSLPEFNAWLEGLKDRQTQFRLLRRLEKAQRGLLGDVAPVGDGVHEMREFFGPGWRMYYIQHNDTIVVMLGGGDKSTQKSDIAKAKVLAVNLKEI